MSHIAKKTIVSSLLTYGQDKLEFLSLQSIRILTRNTYSKEFLLSTLLLHQNVRLQVSYNSSSSIAQRQMGGGDTFIA